MSFRRRAYDGQLLVIFGSFSPKNKQTKHVVRAAELGPLLQFFLDLRIRYFATIAIKAF